MPPDSDSPPSPTDNPSPTGAGPDANLVVETRLDSAILDRAYRDQVLLRRWPFRVAIVVLITVAVIDELRRGAPGPVTFIGVAVILLMVAIYLFVWQRLRTNVRRTLDRMGDGAVRYTVGADAFTMESKLGRTEFPWPTLTRLVVRPTYTLAFVGSHEWITLPTKALGSEGVERLAERCRAASVPVSDRR